MILRIFAQKLIHTEDMKRLLFAYSMFLLLCIQAQQAPTKVFLVAGQSNTDGRVDNTDLPTYIKDNGFQHCWLSYGSGALSGKGLFLRFQPRMVEQKGGAMILYYII